MKRQNNKSILKHFMSWIFVILASLPFIFVIGTMIYTQANPNAKDSYYGDNINEVQEVFTHNDYVVGNRYYLNIGNVPYTTSQNEVIFSVTDVTSSFGDMPTCNNIHIRTQNNATYCLFYNGSSYINDRNFASTNVSSISFVYVSDNGVDLLSQYDLIYYLEYNKYSFLDHALPYALSEFNDIGFGKIDLVSWFTNIFLPNDSLNNVYVTFINSYFNYFIFTELVYLTTLVFTWFITFSIDIITDYERRR